MTPEQIITRTAEYFRLPKARVMGRDRHMRVAMARHVAMYVIRQHVAYMSFPEIGDVFGRDHTTVMSGVERVRECVERGEAFVVDAVRVIVERASADARAEVA